MRMHLDLQRAGRTQAGNGVEGGKGVEYAKGVGETEAPGACRFGSGKYFFKKGRVGPRCVLAAEAHFKPGFPCHRHPACDALQNLVAIGAELVPDLLVGYWHGELQHVHRKTAAGIDIRAGQPAPDDQLRVVRRIAQGVCNCADVIALIDAHGRDADLQFRNTDRRENGGDAALLAAGECHPGGLFSVAQGGVVDDDRGQHGVLVRKWCELRRRSVQRPFQGR